MASVVFSCRGGQIYYCFDCDRTFTIIPTSDSGIICPTCGHVLLEEFETPPSSPSPPPRSPAFIAPLSFFPTSDTDSDGEPSEGPLPPPPPLPFLITTPTTSTGRETILPETAEYLSHLQIQPPLPPPPPPRSIWDFDCPFDSEVRHLRPPSAPTPPPPPPPPLPSVSVSGRRPPCPQFPVPSAPAVDNFFLSPHEENETTQYSHFGSELPLPPSPPPEYLLRSPTLSPSSSSDVWESFYPPSTELEEDTPNQQMRSLIQPPPPPTLLRSWDYFFPHISEPELNNPNQPSQLQPPPPPPWLQAPPMEGLLDMKMTKKLVSEWECHQCSICIDDFVLNQNVKLTPCNHLYHSDCLLRWLELHKSCPVCRCNLPSQ